MNTTENFRAINGYIYVDVDKERNDTVSIKGEDGNEIDLVIDTKFDPFNYKYVRQFGIVKYPTAKIPQIKEGDKVYFTHNGLREDQQIVFDNETLYEIRGASVYCIVRDGELITMPNWNLIKPIKREIYESDSGIVGVENKPEYIMEYGNMAHPSPEMEEEGVESGDKCYFGSHPNYDILVEGEHYWRVDNRTLLAFEKA